MATEPASSPRKTRSIAFTEDLWASIENEATKQNRSLNNMLESIALDWKKGQAANESPEKAG